MWFSSLGNIYVKLLLVVLVLFGGGNSDRYASNKNTELERSIETNSGHGRKRLSTCITVIPTNTYIDIYSNNLGLGAPSIRRKVG